MNNYANFCLIICSKEITKNVRNKSKHSLAHTYSPDVSIGIVGQGSWELRPRLGLGLRLLWCPLVASSCSVRDREREREVKTFRFATFRCKSLKHRSNKKLTSVAGSELPKLYRTHDPLISAARAFLSLSSPLVISFYFHLAAGGIWLAARTLVPAFTLPSARWRLAICPARVVNINFVHDCWRWQSSHWLAI